MKILKKTGGPMKAPRLSTILAVVGAVGAGAALFWTSQHVQNAEDRIARLKSEVAQERQAIRVLETEWVYLNRPARLEELAREYLQLKPPESASVSVDTDILPEYVVPAMPRHKPALPEARPATLKMESAPASAPIEKKSALPEAKSFNSLLESLREGEGG
jgi:cell division protein FtsL